MVLQQPGSFDTEKKYYNILQTKKKERKKNVKLNKNSIGKIHKIFTADGESQHSP